MILRFHLSVHFPGVLSVQFAVGRIQLSLVQFRCLTHTVAVVRFLVVAILHFVDVAVFDHAPALTLTSALAAVVVLLSWLLRLRASLP